MICPGKPFLTYTLCPVSLLHFSIPVFLCPVPLFQFLTGRFQLIFERFLASGIVIYPTVIIAGVVILIEIRLIIIGIISGIFLIIVIGVIPGWGDMITLFCVVPFIYFSTHVIKSIPLTLAIINNALRDILLGMIPFFIGDIIDVFHRANTKNMAMIQGFVDGNETVIKEVNRKALQSAVVLIILLILIALMIWALVSFGSYLYSQIASILY